MQAWQVSETGPRDDSSDECFFKIEPVLVIQGVVINLKSRPATARDVFVPAIGAHQPNARVRLRVNIDNQHFFLVQLCQSGSDIYNRCRLPNPSLEIDKSEDS